MTLAPEYEDYLFEQWEHGVFDDYWKQLGIYAEGFYDQFADARDGAHVVVVRRRTRAPRPTTTSGSRSEARAGAAHHGAVDARRSPAHVRRRRRLRAGRDDRRQCRAGLADAAAALVRSLAKGVENGVDDEPTVRIFVMGGGSGRKNAAGRLDHGGRWRSETDWPLPDTRWTPYYLHRDGVAVSREASAAGACRASIDYDPRIRCRRSAGP